MFDTNIPDPNLFSIAFNGDPLASDTAISMTAGLASVSGSVTPGYDRVSPSTVRDELSPESSSEMASYLNPIEGLVADSSEGSRDVAAEWFGFNPPETLASAGDRSTDEGIGALTGQSSEDPLTGIAEGDPLVPSLNSGVVTSDPGNTVTSAYNLGTLTGSSSLSEFLGNGDPNDFYRFELDTTSNVRLTLNGLAANADVQLIQDINGNGLVDLDEVLAGSYTLGNNPEAIDRDLAPGSYYIQVYPHSFDTNYTLSLTADPLTGAFDLFSFTDASGDSTTSSVFQGGAIGVSYSVKDAPFLSDVQLEAWRNDELVANLETWSKNSLSNAIVNLAGLDSLTGGDYTLRAVGRTSDGQTFYSSFQSMTVLGGEQMNGTFAGEVLDYSGGLQTGTVVRGRGGTDTLNLVGLSDSDILSLNGQSLSAFDPFASAASQAIFAGTAFDYLTLADGREIYFQGIENLQFADGSTLEFQVRPDDTHFGFQWNLHVSDVSSAWRFTQGLSDVLLVSLDTGILTARNAEGDIVDIATNRLMTDSPDDDNYGNYGHGHSAISVMAGETNNGSGIAGINWNSPVMVHDVYGRNSNDYLLGRSGVTLMQAIEQSIAYARANKLRVVFQGGIQGESWLTNSLYRGGTRSQFEQLIRNNADIALFAIAAGNGGPGGNLNDLNYLTSVSGVAKLETDFSNVISVGALQAIVPVGTTSQWQVEWINGLMNATAVTLAPYSNRGSNLTLVAATDSPAMDKFNEMRFFAGTSAANPNLAGIASLVWSVNPQLTGEQIRQILIATAMDLGSEGRDDTFGYGLVDADAAVRRSLALAHKPELANLYTDPSLVT